MFRFFLYASLLLVHVFCQSTDDNFSFNTDLFVTDSTTDANSDASQSWDSMTTETSEVNATNETIDSWTETTTEEPFEFSTGAESNQSWGDLTTEEPWNFNITNDTFDSTTEESWNFNTTDDAFETTTEESWDFNTTNDTFESTTEESWNFNTTNDPFETTSGETAQSSTEYFIGEETTEAFNWDSTTEQVTDIVTTMTSTICPSVITPEMLEEIKREIIEAILRNITNEFNDRIEELEARLLDSNCSETGITSPLQLSWQIYENLKIPLTGWRRVFDEPYSHPTRFEDLNQITGICHNEVLVGAKYDKLITLAAVGPVNVLTLNTLWNQPQQFGQVYWYSSSGRSFGFAPTSTIRQTSADNQDLDSPQRLSWILDQNTGGYRAGVARSLSSDSMWRKIIYCN